MGTCHVFMQLGGFGDDEHQFVPPPFATSERGQIHKIADLNAGGKWTYDALQHKIIKDDAGGSWTCAALGGAARVALLRSLLSDLQTQGVRLTIITKGYVGAVRRILAD